MNILVLAQCACLAFSAPADTNAAGAIQPVTSYELWLRDDVDFSYQVQVLGRNCNTTLPPPRAPGLQDSVWFVTATDSHSRYALLYSLDINGNKSPRSNAVVFRVGGAEIRPDTAWYDVVSNGWFMSDSAHYKDFGNGYRMVSRARSFDDLGWDGNPRWVAMKPPWEPAASLPMLASQEEVQRAWMPTLCLEEGCWDLRGVCQPCTSAPGRPLYGRGKRGIYR